MWFRKNKEREVLTYKEIEEIKLKLVKELDELSPQEFFSLIFKAKEVPEVIKIKLYNFIIEFNVFDSCIDSAYKQSLGIDGNVSSNSKGVNTTLNELYKSKDRKLECFLKSYANFNDQETSKALIIIKDAIKLRDRIAHAIPFWYPEENAVLFYSYDGVFWNKFYNSMRQEKSKFYKDDYFIEQRNQTKLSEKQFTYILYHLYEINFLTEKIKSIRLILIDDFKCD